MKKEFSTIKSWKVFNDEFGYISESNEVLAGKNLFKCFLKALTALGMKDTKPDWEETPESFLIFFRTISTNVNDLKSVMSRYQHFDTFINKIDYTQNECQLYFGIKCDSIFQYGIITEEQFIPIGHFKLTKGILNWILTLDSSSSINLKKEIVHLDLNKISLLCKIKNEMKNFIPGSSEKKSPPKINGDVITFGYYGIGKWDNGKMDEGEFQNIKSNFKTFLCRWNWSEKIQVSLTTDQLWLFLNIKLK